MLRCFVSVLSWALVVLSPSFALAAGEDCPDGWFCEPNAAPLPGPSRGPVVPPPPSARSQLGAPSRPGAPPGPPSSADPDSADSADPADYSAGGDTTRGELSLEVPPDPPARGRRRRGFREWGFNLHLEGALSSHEPTRGEGPWLGGLGFAFRYRAIPALALEVGVDLLKSPEQRGVWRSEAVLLFNTLAFLNPHDVAQAYVLGGMAFSAANVSAAAGSADFRARRDQRYSYFGGQLGLGVEIRISRRVAVASDVIGFIRGRTDEHWEDTSGNIDGTERRSNTSGGGLLRAGVTLYW
jgi:hypothetical protein